MTFTRYNHVALIIFLLINFSFSQRADFGVPQGQRNRRFSWSTEAPLAKAINDLAPDAIPPIGLLIRHATRVENAVLESLKQKRVDPIAIVQPCDPQIRRTYRNSVRRGFGIQGFLEPAYNCGADVNGVKMTHGEEPGYTLDDLYEAMFNRGAAISRRVNEIALRVIDNFTEPSVAFNFTYNTESANCVLHPVCIKRQEKHWYSAIGIHNRGLEDYQADGQQQSIQENVRVVDGQLKDNLLFRLPVYDDGTIERVMLDNTTTKIQAWRGIPNPSCFQPIPIEENPAMVDALDLADHSVQQTQDALTWSNLAILMLPLGLNLVPVSLFAEVDTVTLLLYTILSDILTVIPLGIKGVELIVIQQQKFRSVVTRVLSPASGNSTRPNSTGGEIWGAECRVRGAVQRMGVVLIVLSVVFLVIGIGGEILARNYVMQIKKRRYERFGKMERVTDEVSTLNGDIGTGDMAERYSSDFERLEEKKRILALEFRYRR